MDLRVQARDRDLMGLSRDCLSLLATCRSFSGEMLMKLARVPFHQALILKALNTDPPESPDKSAHESNVRCIWACASPHARYLPAQGDEFSMRGHNHENEDDHGPGSIRCRRSGVACHAQTADQTGRHATPPLWENNVFWGMESEPQPSRGYGSSVYPAGQPPRDVGAAPGAVDVHAQPRILDCVHVAFPQCSGG
jgi:hypothetical protein